MIHSLTGIMKELVLLFAISILPFFCAGLECKQGTAHRDIYNITDEDIYKNSICAAEDAKYCVAATCTKAGADAFSFIMWMCAPVINKKDCGRIAEEEAVSKGLTVTKNFVCKCPYGAEGEDFSNAKFELLPMPISTLLTCKKGDFDSEEYGGAYKAECSHDEDKYCYMASCAKGNKHVMTVWNCSPDTDCTAISAEVGKTVNAKKPTTTTGKPTTTTDKPTTTTDKTTTTTDNPTTTTDKPTTTSGKQTTTTAEGN
uniref:Uncharacterized protein n=1 Tax=Globodera rostochiensis TaxID=31243 RepID=A0A914GSQ5_GLORO